LDPATFAAEDALAAGASTVNTMPIDQLLAGNVLSYVVPCKSDLGLMLGPAGLIGDSAPEHQTVAVR
jgi:hypothetical protein